MFIIWFCFAIYVVSSLFCFSSYLYVICASNKHHPTPIFNDDSTFLIKSNIILCRSITMSTTLRIKITTSIQLILTFLKEHVKVSITTMRMRKAVRILMQAWVVRCTNLVEILYCSTKLVFKKKKKRNTTFTCKNDLPGSFSLYDISHKYTIIILTAIFHMLTIQIKHHCPLTAHFPHYKPKSDILNNYITLPIFCRKSLYLSS